MSWIIRLQRLPLSANAADIRTFFSGLRIPDGAVHIVGGPDGDAFIGFATDEDARQAMRFDQRRIHDQRVRLLLSSRVEMDAVIAKARSGDLGSAAAAVASPRRDDPTATAVSVAVTQPPPAQLLTVGATPTDAYRVGGIGIGVGVPATGYQQDFNRDSWTRTEVQSDSWKNGPKLSYDSRPVVTAAPNVAGVRAQSTVGPWQDPKMMNVFGGQTASNTNVYQHNQYEQDSNFQGYNASVQPSTATQNAYSQLPSSADSNTQPFLSVQPKTEAAPTPIYQQTNPSASTILPAQGLQMPPTIPGMIVPPIMANSMPNVSSAAVVANPAAFAPYTGRNGPIFSSLQTGIDEKQICYVRLSRLPSELLRPAALEQFLRTSVPLTLSSVKVVFDPKGFPLHSLVRFENAKDAQMVLSRDGEQGIRIRPCTKEMFDEAVDGSLQTPPAFLQPKVDKIGDYPRDKNGRGIPIGRQHYSPDRREADGRRDDRLRMSSRDREERHRPGPRRIRSRSRSPMRNDHRDTKRRGDQAGRYCIEFTNLPFRVTESEIREFLGPRCEATKVTRAFNEDGQASDRWIAEFITFDMAEKAYRTRGKVQERSIRARRITNEEADQMLSVPDKFGRQRKEEYERKYGMISTESENPTPLLDVQTSRTYGGGNEESTSHFQGPIRGRGRGRGGLYRGGGGFYHGPDHEEQQGPATGPGPASINGGLPNAPGPQPPRFMGPRMRNGPLIRGGPPRAPLISPPTFFGTAPSSTIRQRGPPPPALRGPRPPNNFHPPNNGPAGPLPQGSGIPPPSVKSCLMIENVPEDIADSMVAEFIDVAPSPSVRRTDSGTIYIDLGSMDEATKIAVRCNGRKLRENTLTVKAISRQQMLDSTTKKASLLPESEVLEPDLIASVGEPGTVISAHGFPANVTLNDVAQFFDKYSLVESSVRIKLDDNGVPTGECLLALGTPQEASKAVMLLSGRKLGGSTVTMSVVKPSK